MSDHPASSTDPMDHPKPARHLAAAASAGHACRWPGRWRRQALGRTGILRIGSLVPKNSLYHQQLLELGEAWRKAQGEGSRFVVFTDGSQGGEAELARRMRIGQLQGALLSVVGLREIEPSISALQNLPLLFKSWDEVDHVREKMRPAMEKRFLDKGFVVLGWGDAGWVRFFSKAPAFRPDDYKGMKFFAWGSEGEQQAIMKSLGYTPVPLETADILPSIQTGMINVVPSTPYFALASQVYDTASHMLEINWAPIVGALVVTRKAWDDMSPGRPAGAAGGRRTGRCADAQQGPQRGGRGCRRHEEARAHGQQAQPRSDARSGTRWPRSCTRASGATWCRRRPSTRSSCT